jgi:demethylsterigmatocystin 6-O-methyltransferase
MTSLKSADWIAGFDLIDQEAQKVSSGPADGFTKPFFVDVGGGYGRQCIMLAKKYPNLRDHLVLQDLPEAVKKLPPIEGVKAEAYDFFEKQPITGMHCGFKPNFVLIPRYRGQILLHAQNHARLVRR